MDMWTYSQFGLDAMEGERIQRVGINFGAPGDRRAPDGTLWLEYPDTSSGMSPGLRVTVAGENAKYFQRHSSQVSGQGIPWVGASGLVNAETITISPTLTKPAMKKSSSKDKDKDEDNDKPAKPGSKPSAGSSKKSIVEAPPPAPVPSPSHPPAPYTVRLHFLEPDGLPSGARVFTVTLQDQTVLEHFDIATAAGGAGRAVIKEFRHIIIGDDLVIRLTPAPGTKSGPALCGVELISETVTADAGRNEGSD
jgi:hypothetical protein